MMSKWRIAKASGEFEKATGATLVEPGALERFASLRQLIIPSSLVFYMGEPTVRQYFAVQDQTMATKQQTLHIAASLVQHGQHPILQALKRACVEEGMAPREAEMDEVEEFGGVGRVDRSWYVLGNEAVMAAQEIEIGVSVMTLARQFELEGKYTVYLAQRHPKRLMGIFACEYELVSGSGSTVAQLREQGVESILLTATKTSIAKGIGTRLSVSLIHSELGDTEKERIIASLVRQQPDSAILLSPRCGMDGHGSVQSFTIGVGGAQGSVTLADFADLPGALAEARRQAGRSAFSLLKS
jgi:hypothetical protein